MAQRRLFSLKIVASDAFLDMPTSSRELYFHLGMYADDDGFVNPKKIVRMLGASDDDLKVLLAKRFVLAFENGVVVIKHWLIHNTILKDRYKETLYLEEKKRLIIKENGSYTECIQNDNILLPQVKLSQVKLSKDNIVETSSTVWLLEEKLKEMEQTENSYLDIIATFIREKPVKVENSRQLSEVISRYCKIAKKLSGAYTNTQIFGAAKKIKEDNKGRERRGGQEVDWVLETVYKQLTK